MASSAKPVSTLRWGAGLAAALLLALASALHTSASESKEEPAELIAEGFQTLLPLFAKAHEFYARHGRLPVSRSELEMGSSTSYRKGALESISLVGPGIFELTFDERTGVEHGVVQWRPHLDHLGFLRYWVVTTDYEWLPREMPDGFPIPAVHVPEGVPMSKVEQMLLKP